MGVGTNPKKGSSNPQLGCIVRKYIPKWKNIDLEVER